MANEIKTLSMEVQKVIRTGIGITSLSECVLELIYNAIDSTATCIAVRVDFTKKVLVVVDNGEGFTKHGLEVVGQRYMTSKINKLNDLKRVPNYFGFKGEALSNVIELSENVVITSRQKGAQTYQKIFHRGEPFDVNEVRRRPSKGTTFTSFGLFHQMPIRQRCMNRITDIQQIKTIIQNIALIYPNVSFSFTDITNDILLFGVKPKDNIPERYDEIFEQNVEEHFAVVGYEQDGISVKAYISKCLSKFKDRQFIYVNNRFVNCKVISKLLNSLLKPFLKDKATEMRSGRHEKQKFFKFTPMPSTDTNPVFIINITTTIYNYISTIDPKSYNLDIDSNNILLKVCEEVVDIFFKKHLNSEVDHENREISAEVHKNNVGHDMEVGLYLNGLQGKFATRVDNQMGMESSSKEVTQSGKRKLDTKECKDGNIIVTKLHKNENLFATTSACARMQKLLAEVENIRQRYSKRHNSTINIRRPSLRQKKVGVTEKTASMKANISCETCQIHTNSIIKKLYQTELPSRQNYHYSKIFSQNNKNQCGEYNYNEIDKRLIETEIKSLQNRINYLHDVYSSLFGINGTNICKKNDPSVQCGNYNYLDPKTKEYKQLEMPNNVYNRSSPIKYSRDQFSPKDNYPGCTRHETVLINMYNKRTSIEFNSQSENRSTSTGGITDIDDNSFVYPKNSLLIGHNTSFTKIHDGGTDAKKSVHSDHKMVLDNMRNECSKDNQCDLANACLSDVDMILINQHNRSSINTVYDTSNESDVKSVYPKKSEHEPLLTNMYNERTETDGFGFTYPMVLNKIFNGTNFYTAGSPALICEIDNINFAHPKNYEPDNNKPSLTNTHNRSSYTGLKSPKVDKINEFSILCTKGSGTKSKIAEINYKKSFLIKSPKLDTHRPRPDSTLFEPQVEIIQGTQLESHKSTNPPEIVLNGNTNCKTQISNNRNMEIENEDGKLWTEKLDSKGQLYFINSKTGCSYYDQQKLKDAKSFLMKNRFVFLPKGISPIVHNMTNINVDLDKNSRKTEINNNILDPNSLVQSGVKKILDKVDITGMDYQSHYESEIAAANNNGLMNFRSHSLLEQVTFNHNIFKKLQVLGQVDNKFIICLLNDGIKISSSNDKVTKMLVLFDQHAVDERIRLEKLLAVYTCDEDKTSLSRQKLDKGLKFELSDMNLFTLKQSASNFTKSGFEWVLDESAKIAIFHQVPLCLYKKFQDKSQKDMIELMSSVLWDQYYAILTMKGIQCGILKTLMDIINTEACRGAIKFGDAISLDRCYELLTELSKCQTPFICAHGRPNVLALADIGQTSLDVVSKPRLQRLQSIVPN